MSKQQVSDAITNITVIFNVFIFLIGVITLTISFFLLLIATNQNVTEAIWEYGVLRSMGVTKDEGRRIFMYESMIVVLSAALLGILVGCITATIIAAQFYMFLELPLHVDIPWTLVGIMLLVALTTTFVAVWFPVR